MRRITFALATAAALGLASAAMTGSVLAQEVKIKVGDRHDRHGVVIHQDRGRHLGWERRHFRDRARSVTVIKKRHGNTVIKKRIEG